MPVFEYSSYGDIMLSRFAKLAGAMPKETLRRTSARFFQTVAPRLTNAPPHYIFPAVAIVAGGIGYFARRPETGDPDLKDLAPSFKTFVEDHLVNGPSTALHYQEGVTGVTSKPFDADLVKALALQAQKTLGREMVAMTSLRDLFYCPIQKGDGRPYRKRDDELRDTIDMLKHIDDKHLISAKMRREISQGLVPPYSGILKPLCDIDNDLNRHPETVLDGIPVIDWANVTSALLAMKKAEVELTANSGILKTLCDIYNDLHRHPETVLEGIPVIHWANVTNALLAMKKDGVELTPKIILSLQRNPQAAENIGAGIISLKLVERERIRAIERLQYRYGDSIG
jgi:hypothetical protein